MVRGENFPVPDTPRTPLLYVERNGLELIGVEEAFASGDIEEQRVAIDSLIAICRVFERGPAINNNSRAMENSKHHIYGGPHNAEQIADDRVTRRFYVDQRNITRIRRDTHDWWEENYGWPIFPSRLDMAHFNLSTESNLSSKDRKACLYVIRTEG